MNYLKSFELFEKEIISGGIPVEKSIKFARGISKENKEIALGLLKQYSRCSNGRITGLNLHSDLKKKISEKSLPSGFDMGIDKDGFYVHTHRARCKSFPSPGKIGIKEIKFIASTG
jgi:hypothetical protein